MFVNLSNHSSKNWSNKQLVEANKYGDIYDITFPVVNPNGSKEYIEKMANDYLKSILELKPDCVMCQGEFCFSYAMINLLKEHNIKVVAACSERKTIEKVEDGKSQKLSVFEFVQFREY